MWGHGSYEVVRQVTLKLQHERGIGCSEAKSEDKMPLGEREKWGKAQRRKRAVASIQRAVKQDETHFIWLPWTIGINDYSCSRSDID